MDVDEVISPGEAGFALLLGPTWSIVLNSTRTTFGRSARTYQESMNGEITHTNSDLRNFESIASQSGQMMPRSLEAYPKHLRDHAHKDSAPSKLPSRRQIPNFEPNPSFPYSDASLALNDSNPSFSPNFASGPSSSMPDPSEQPHHTLQGMNHGNRALQASSTTTLSHGERNPRVQGDGHVDLGSDPLISRLHATISYDFDCAGWRIFCHSKNGLQLNGASFSSKSRPKLLKSGSRVQIGSVSFLFLLPVPSSSTPLSGLDSPPITSLSPPDGLVVDMETYQAPTVEKPKKRRIPAERRVGYAVPRLFPRNEEFSVKRGFSGDQARVVSFDSLAQTPARPINAQLASRDAAPVAKRTSYGGRASVSTTSDTSGNSLRPRAAQQAASTSTAEREVGASVGGILPPREDPNWVPWYVVITELLETTPSKAMPVLQIIRHFRDKHPERTKTTYWADAIRSALGNASRFAQLPGRTYGIAAWYDGSELLSSPKI